VRLEPIANRRERQRDVIGMLANVLSGDVGAEHVIAVAIPVQNEANLPTVLSRPVPSRSQEEPEFQRHVEPGEAVPGVERRAGKIVYSEPAVPDNAKELVNSYLTAIVLLLRAPRKESALMDAKDQRPQQLPVTGVEGNVEKDLPAVGCHSPSVSVLATGQPAITCDRSGP
jgi:hypothetical protein